MSTTTVEPRRVPRRRPIAAEPHYIRQGLGEWGPAQRRDGSRRETARAGSVTEPERVERHAVR
ncbi:hypothetical protein CHINAEXTREME_06365 [Halobiforma lacisalsi AJ5]|uniref:Uncharacterized protein n=1 Tax=Natronobacterium lacisalsi AJ5 TaxID=358396 RepID=A0A1P8LNP0_NATLA|nr:hypothetical protein [Halobiforma lacisalsi]APW97417.1 hypothetical protein CHINAEXTREME_06365 [Halobiforma lacisalsi AJ5]